MTDQKTGGKRTVPIIGERLRQVLREAFERAENRDGYVCGSVSRSNLDRDAKAIIQAAGLPVYSKPFHTLRKCLETEWIEADPPLARPTGLRVGEAPARGRSKTMKMPAERSAAPLLRRGDLVEVYQKPLTDEESEGIATLVRPIGEVDPVTGIQSWVVRFPGDGLYERAIHPRHRRA